jgi:hypothetical protein
MNNSTVTTTVTTIASQETQITPVPQGSTLRVYMDKFKRILPLEKYTTLESLVNRLQHKQISKNEFDKDYFEIMLPYVAPKNLPERFIGAKEIHISPYKLSEDGRKNFLQYFTLPTTAREDHLKNNPELVPVLKQLVLDIRSQKIPVYEKDNVLKLDGEEEIAIISSLPVQDEKPRTRKRRRCNEDTSAKEEDDDKFKQYKAEMEAQLEQYKKENEELKQQLAIYRHGKHQVLETMSYESLCNTSDELFTVLSNINQVKKQKHVEEQNDKHMMQCILCYERRRNVVFRPCSHIVQCNECPIPKECHLCKKKVELASKVFI